MKDDKSIKRFVQKIKRRRIAAVRRVKNCVRFAERLPLAKTEVKCLL